MLKRLLDIALSVFGLLAALPLFILIAAAMAIRDPGPLFYRQSRVGRHKRPFQMIKFRTMVVDADKHGPHVTAKHDPRITPVGAFLRRSKLDELPELWNVLIGDMSLVGPRPEVPRYVAKYKLEWDEVFDARPGITDLATLQFRDEESVLEGISEREAAYLDVILPIKIEMALWYVRNQTVLMDMRILIDTVLAITVGKVWPMTFGPDWASIARDRLNHWMLAGE